MPTTLEILSSLLFIAGVIACAYLIFRLHLIWKRWASEAESTGSMPYPTWNSVLGRPAPASKITVLFFRYGSKLLLVVAWIWLLIGIVIALGLLFNFFA